MIYHPYLAVVGRLDGDDEDSLETFSNMTIDEAKAAFRAWKLEDVPPEYHGKAGEDSDPVYINFILTSDSPITVQEDNT